MAAHAAETRCLPAARPEQLREYLSCQVTLASQQRELAQIMRSLHAAQRELLHARRREAEFLCRRSAELAAQSRRVLQYQDDLRRFLLRRRIALRACRENPGA
jgi:hypothetical protein